MRANNKKLYLIFGLILGLALSVSGVFISDDITLKEKSRESNTVKTVKLYPDSATNTQMATIPEKFIHVLDSNYLGQGVCVKIKDIGGNGYTYLTTSDGVGTFSKISCE